MATKVYKGSFSANTSTGNQVVSGIVDEEGAAFTPVAVIFFVTRQTATGYQADGLIGMGFTDGTTSAAFCLGQQDNVASGNTWRAHYASPCIIQTNTGAVDGWAANAVTLASGQFTISWTDAPSSAWLIHYIALGGDINQAKVVTQTADADLGSDTFTGAGFTPEFCLMFCIGSTTAPNTTSAEARVGIGMTDGTNEFYISSSSRDNQTNSQVGSTQRSDKAMGILTIGASPSVDGEADITTFNSDGVELNWSNALAFGFQVSTLYLAGGDYAVGVETASTTVATKDTSLAFDPAGLLAFSWNLAASAAVDLDDNRLTFGAADGGGRNGCIWYMDTEAGTTDSNTASLTDKFLRFATNPSTTDDEATVTLGVSKFTTDWTTVSGIAKEFGYVAFGPAPAAAATEAIVDPIGKGVVPFPR